MRLEGNLAREVDRFLETLPNCLVIKKDQGPYSGKRGISDRILCYKGYFVSIELKVGKNKATRLQERFLREVEEAKGFHAVCYFLSEVKELMKRIDTWIINGCQRYKGAPIFLDKP